MCIASVIVAVAFREKGSNPLLASTKPVLTIGNDAATAADLEYFGATHKVAQVDQIVVDEYFKIVTTPAYMLGPNISDIAKGIARLVKQIVAWV